MWWQAVPLHKLWISRQAAPGSFTSGDMMADQFNHGGTCANCAAPLTGPFCAQCGQRAHLHRTLGEVVHEFAHGITHFDGKAWKTLPMLLFQPGKLTRSYIEGQRARYIAPVPLFLLVVFTMFFVLSFASFGDFVSDNRATAASDRAGMARALADIDAQITAARTAGDRTKVIELESLRAGIAAMNRTSGGGEVKGGDIITGLGEGLSKAIESDTDGISRFPVLDAKAREAVKNPRLMLYKLQTKAYKLSFLLVPLSLPWLWLAFVWRRGVGLYDHAIFTLYSISFMSLLFIAASLLLMAPAAVSDPLWLPLLLAPGAHLFVQLRGAYSLGWFGAAWRTVYLSLAAAITLSAYLLILVVLGVLD